MAMVALQCFRNSHHPFRFYVILEQIQLGDFAIPIR